MTLYTFLETAIIVLIGVISAYHVIKLLMPRLIKGVRASVAQRLGRGAAVASWRHAVASKVRPAASESACGTDCSSGGCHGCSVAARTDPPVSANDQSLR